MSIFYLFIFCVSPLPPPPHYFVNFSPFPSILNIHHIFSTSTFTFTSPTLSSPVPLSSVLCTKDLLDGEARHRVEEEDKEDGESEEGEQLQYGPFVIVPNDVTDALQWIEEPHEGGIWSAVRKERAKVEVSSVNEWYGKTREWRCYGKY